MLAWVDFNEAEGRGTRLEDAWLKDDNILYFPYLSPLFKCEP